MCTEKILPSPCRGLSLLLLVLALAACGGGGSGGGGVPGPALTYDVTYDGNGNATGTVPVDSGSYEQGQMVTVLGNTGNLTRGGYSFGGWSTQANGSGINYNQGETFVMETADVTLFAVWSPAMVEPTLASIQDNVFTPTCATASCHSGSTPAGGLNLESGNSYGNLVNVTAQVGIGGQNTLVVSTDPDNSVLIIRLEQDSASPLLEPQGGPRLSQDTINAIRTWIVNLPP